MGFRSSTSLVQTFGDGPSILAVPFRHVSQGKARPILSLRERAALGDIATLVTVRKGMQVYRAGDVAAFVYILDTGYVKTQRALPNGKTQVTAFRSTGDLLGLATEGRYVETAIALGTTTAFRVPLDALEALLACDASIGCHLLCKLGSVMVAQQNHALILGRNDAQGKLAMFLDAWERGQRERGYDTEMIYLPMSRSDIAAYVGLTVEAVSRTFTAFAVQGLVSFRAKRQVRLIDRAGLHALIGVAARPHRTAHAPHNPAFAQP